MKMNECPQTFTICRFTGNKSLNPNIQIGSQVVSTVKPTQPDLNLYLYEREQTTLKSPGFIPSDFTVDSCSPNMKKAYVKTYMTHFKISYLTNRSKTF